MRASSALALVLALAPSLVQAQKRALTQADWDRWRSISGAALTNDGRWAVFTVAPLVGDGELIARSTSSATEYRVPRGYLGRPNNTPGGLRPRNANPEEEPAGPTIAPAQLTADSRYAVFLTYPAQAEFDAAGRDRRRASALQNRSDLAILRLSDGTVTAVPRVRSFRLPRHRGSWVAYVAADSAPLDTLARGQGGQTSRPGPRRRFGSALVLRNLETGAEERIPDVLDFVFDDSAKVLAYTVVSRAENRDGAFVRDLASGRVTTLLSGRGDYDQIALDRGASQAAFVSNRDAFGRDNAYSLYHASLRDGSARVAVAPAALGGLRVAETANITFTRGGSAVLFGIAPPAIDTLSADSLVNKAVFDLWHYKDPNLQPTQRLTAARDRTRSFRAIYHVAANRFVKLANDSIPTVSVSADGRIAVANSDERYAMARMWGEDGNDIYVIDALTGVVRMVRENISGQGRLSPEGRYVTFFNDGRWYVYTVATGRTAELTATVRGVSFAREIHDRPSPSPAWGIAGWTRGERSVLVYDRFDIWELDPAGTRAAVMVTDSLGRRENLALRLATGMAGGGGGGGFGFGGGGGGDSDDERTVDPSKPVLLSAFDEDTKASGFYRDQLGVDRDPERVVMADAAFWNVIKASNAEQYLVSRGTFVDFPNLYTGTSLASLTRISDANPQQRAYNWGTVELVKWVSTDGIPLHGLLFKPEHFDSTKKYPMVTYFYEKLSQNLHSYVAPFGRNVINPTHYASNGYIVFEPDIHYEEGYPGPSAMKSIIPGIQMLLQRSYIDPKALGVNGQSWGGYQALYMITQSHIFRAAMAGAPVVNMTSAYGGIRWGSGVARPAMYETGQSRIGGSIWEYPMRFIENSPLFWLDKVTTPLLIMHNDADDAVPWYQGIETFVALRRLGKEVYLINYNNDVHNPQSRANQKDIAMRMQQFFDHHLRGMPAPDWMKKGIPYLSKGRDQVPSPVTTPATPATPNP